jgi:hypothetical protein
LSDAEERERIAAELRRIRQDVHERALREREPREVLPPPQPTRSPSAAAPPAEPAPPALPRPPDGAAVNQLWQAHPAREPTGLRGLLSRALRRLLGPTLEAQVAFNSRQVQLDNEILAYIDARFQETHRHYDEVLGVHGRHMGEIDERHLILQEELVAHVHDLVRRIDLVLAEAERGRVGLEFALRDLRARLARLEERLARG